MWGYDKHYSCLKALAPFKLLHFMAIVYVTLCLTWISIVYVSLALSEILLVFKLKWHLYFKSPWQHRCRLHKDRAHIHFTVKAVVNEYLLNLKVKHPRLGKSENEATFTLGEWWWCIFNLDLTVYSIIVQPLTLQ